jgi:phosphoglycerate dehydrogenase-like enzyme
MPKIKLLAISPPNPRILESLAPLQEWSEVSVSNDPATLPGLAAAAEVILYSGFAGKSLDFSAVWKYAGAVRWVHSLTAGVEKLLSSALAQSDVPLTNARGVYKRSLAEFAVLGMLFHYKRVRRMVENQRQRKWDSFTVKFTDERVMGIVGYGETGRECALLARALGVKIHALRRNPERSAADPLVDRVFGPEELRRMLAGIDVLLCTAPLTPQTRHMIGDAEFAVMKPSAIAINIGRGPVIDESALVRALQRGKIAGASLDVFEKEPLPEDSPLWDMENVLISPHSTDDTEEPDALELSMRRFVENFHRYRKGEPLESLVDKKAGY